MAGTRQSLHCGEGSVSGLGNIRRHVDVPWVKWTQEGEEARQERPLGNLQVSRENFGFQFKSVFSRV